MNPMLEQQQEPCLRKTGFNLPKKTPLLVWTILGLTTSLLFGCQKDINMVAPEPASDNAIKIASEPNAAVPADLGEVTEEMNSMLFPQNGSVVDRPASTGTTDFVDFDDPLALSIIPDQAAYMFAASPFYIQKVGNAWIHVKENSSGNYKPEFKSNVGHYHLSYQNFEPCLKQNGQFGKPVGGGCTNINPVNEPRTLDTHDNYQWIKIYAYDYTSPKRVFDLLGIKVTKGPLQLWFKKNNGGWYKWSSLGVGTWNLSAYSTGISEVLIAGAGSGYVGFDNIKVKVPAY